MKGVVKSEVKRKKQNHNNINIIVIKKKRKEKRFKKFITMTMEAIILIIS